MRPREIEDLRGMTAEEAAKFVKCGVCRKPISHTGVPLFYLVRLERWGFDVGALRRREGLAQFFGGGPGSHVLADVMGPDRDVARCVGETREICVCEDCAMDRKPPMVALLFEQAKQVKPDPEPAPAEDVPEDVEAPAVSE